MLATATSSQVAMKAISAVGSCEVPTPRDGKQQEHAQQEHAAEHHHEHAWSTSLSLGTG